MRIFPVWILALTLLPLALLAAEAPPRYFPTNAFDSENRGDEFMAQWYSNELMVLKEPSLLEFAKDADAESYRFLWLRTFHHPVAIRLDVKRDGTGILTTKIGSGSAGFPHTGGKVIENTSRALSREQVQSFLTRLDRSEFWSVPSHIKGDQTGTDGSEWIIEGVKRSNYHVVARWSPGEPPLPQKRAVRELGLALAIDLAQLKIPQRELY
jgi:hypothetical protein